MRMTGLYSGMDTETVIQSLVSAKSQKVTDLKNEQKKLEWKQNIWQDLNSQIYSLYSKTLSNMRLSSGYAKKTTKVSDSTKASIVASGDAVNGTQTLSINKTAKAGYLTGAKVNSYTYSTETVTKNSLVSKVNPDLVGKEITVYDANGSQKGKISITADTTIKDLQDQFAANDMTLNYVESSKKFYLSNNDYNAPLQLEDSGGVLNGLGFTRMNANSSGYIDVANTSSYGHYTSDELDGTYTVGTPTSATFTSSSKLSSIASSLSGKTINVSVGDGDPKSITITNDMTISDFISKLKDAGVNASFDENNQRFFISSTSTGADKEFKLTGSDSSVLKALGLDSTATYDNGSEATRIYAQDAEIVLNGATFTSSSNTFTINGLTITANAPTDEELTITTETDYDGIYDMVKDFLSEYNEIINKMYKLYNADSARKYDMLTDDEKDSMTDDEIEAWEDTIKDSLLRRDSSLYSVMSTLRNATTSGYTINGKTMYLSNFGIGTLSYFTAAEDERYALHIDGDEDDENTSTNTDKLKAALASDPDGTVEFFSSLCKNMYDSLYESMKSTDYSSIYKVYDDKRLQDEYDDYTTKVSDYEDYWYDKFSAMETALAKLQTTQNTVSSMLGTS
jgi:flagellar hook-associated protein 2